MQKTAIPLLFLWLTDATVHSSGSASEARVDDYFGIRANEKNISRITQCVASPVPCSSEAAKKYNYIAFVSLPVSVTPFTTSSCSLTYPFFSMASSTTLITTTTATTTTYTTARSTAILSHNDRYDDHTSTTTTTMTTKPTTTTITTTTITTITSTTTTTTISRC